MNIGIYIKSYFPNIGGAQVSTHCLAISFIDLGHKVTIFTSPSSVKLCASKSWEFNYRLASIISPPEILLHTFPSVWRYLLNLFFNRSITNNKFDVVQIINAWPWAIAKLNNKNQRVPIVLRAVGDDLQIDEIIGYGIRRNATINELILDGYKRISFAIANSETTYKEYQNIGLEEDKIKLIIPGVNNFIFNEAISKKDEIRDKYKMPNEKILLIAVGRNHAKKGYSTLVKALKYLNADNNKFIIAIVGKNLKDLSLLARNENQEQNFFPVEEISTTIDKGVSQFPSEELVHLYKSADYFIMPSLLETFGNVKLEAMAAGLPIIVTNTPGTYEGVKHNVNGIIIPKNSPKEIARTVHKLESNPSFKLELIKNALAFAELQDWGNVAKKYLQIYKFNKIPSENI